jgi:hypothetical protein
MNVFEALRRPVGHQARGCFNCKHNPPGDRKCAYTDSFFRVKCIAYYTYEDADKNRVPTDMDDNCREVWQARWDWNGK